MGLFSLIKRNSRLALKGKWGAAIVIYLILAGVSLLVYALRQTAMSIFVPFSGISNPTMEPDFVWNINDIISLYIPSVAELIIMGSSVLLHMLLISPLMLGCYRWFFGIVHSKKMTISDVFYYFESAHNYGRSVWLNISYSIRFALWSIPFYILPSAILTACVYFLSGEIEIPRMGSAVASTGMFLSVILFILATVLYAAFMMRYGITSFLIAEDDKITVRSAFKTSITYTKGFRFSLLWFSLSFLGWLLLCVFLFPVLYVWPYYLTAIAMFARYIIEKNRYAQPQPTQEYSANTGEVIPPGENSPPATEQD